MPTLADIADVLEHPIPAAADPQRRITAPNTLQHAGPDEIALLGSRKYLAHFATTQAGVVVVPADLEPPKRENAPVTFRVADAEGGFLKVLELFAPPRPTGVHPSAVVDPSVVMGRDCYVGPHCYVGPGTILGDRVTLQAHVTIGTDGFGYRWDGHAHRRVPHLGHVEIGDDVEIGANTCVDRGKFPGQPTVIGAGTKIDNLVQIAHNCRVGQHCIIVSGAGMAGSATIGDGVVLAAHVSIRDHVTVGSGSIIAARTGVAKDLPPGSRVGGLPAVEQRQWVRTLHVLETLPELAKEVKRLSKLADG